MKDDVGTLAAAKLWERLESLSDGGRQILRLKSLVFLPTTKTTFQDCLIRSGLRMPSGKAWSNATINPVLEELLRLKLLTRDLACTPLLLHPVAIDAMTSPEGPLMAKAVQRAFVLPDRSASYTYSSSFSLDFVERLLRLAIYANDEGSFRTQRDLFDRLNAPYRAADFLPVVFRDATYSLDWAKSRHPLIQLALFEAKLTAVSLGAAPDPDLPALIAHYRAAQDRPEFTPVRQVLLAHDLQQARLDDAERGLAEIKDMSPLSRAATSGTIAFLQSDRTVAIEHFRLALKLRRKTTGKRKVFLEDIHGLFFIMAMLAENDAALHGELQSGLDAAAATSSQYGAGYAAMRALFWLVQGQEAKASALIKTLRTSMPPEPASAACVALAEWFIDAEIARKHRDDTVARFTQLQISAPLPARIFAELLSEVTVDATPYQAYLDTVGVCIKTRFTRLVQFRAPWERALENLDVFLGGGETKAIAVSSQRSERRLAWFIDFSRWQIDVVEQSPRGLNGWTDGRPVSLKRLYERDPKLDYLTDADIAALRTLRKESGGWYGAVEYEFDAKRTIRALVGHPVVFEAHHRAQRIELVSYPLELVITAAGDGYRIALSHSSAEPTVFIEPETPARYRVVEFPKPMVLVNEILGRGGLVLPKAARDQVVAMVQRDNPMLPIRSEVDDVAARAAEGLASPVLQFTPHEAGLRLQLVVRPFGSAGPAYVAGLGGRSVLAVVDEQQRRVNRDLTRELNERAALIAGCPTLRDRMGTDAHELIVDDLAGSLELLLELQAYPGSVSTEWPEGRAMRVSSAGATGFKLRVAKERDWFNVSGEVTIDEGQVLEMQFLLDRLERSPGRFIALDDGRFIALTHQLQAQLSQLADVSERHNGERRVHKFAAPALQQALGEAGDVSVDSAWKQHVARIRKAAAWTPQIPTTLQAELRDYQIEGFVWLSRLAHWGAGACLADDMGLGKTVQAIAVMLERAADGPILVVAPTSVCPNWISEINRFAPTLKPQRLATATDRATLVAALGRQDVLICSYGLLHQESELLASRDWSMLVLDEAQAIKNAQTKRARASVEINAAFRLALTGTPIENYLDELWSLMNFLNPGLLGSREEFQKRFAIPIERGRDTQARQALRALIRPFLLRRTKATVLSELPPRTEQTISVEMSEGERIFYEALRQRALETIDALEAAKGKRKIHILAEITRLRRACCNPALIDPGIGVPSAKLEAILELVDELLRNRHRALVFSQFTGHLALLRAALDARDIPYEYLDGNTPSAERERRVAAFQAGGAPLFLISLRAGGTGLNLTAADYVLHLDPWWNPAVEDQASDRAHRIGQERPVTIYRLVMQDSIEEKILSLHRDKRDLANDLLDGGEIAARLSEDDLLDLIRI
jgi:superfamily II DNA or RNA helicase